MKMVNELYDKLLLQKQDLKRYMDYYKGEHDILKKKAWTRQERTDVKEVHNFCKLFIDSNVGFLLGNRVQVQYNTDKEGYNLVDYYNDALGYRSQQLDQKLNRDQQIFGFSFEINYINKDGDFDIVMRTPLDVAVKRQGKKVTHAIIDQGDNIFDFMDVLKNQITRYELRNSSVLTKVEGPKLNPINNPIIVVYNNWERMSEMADIMSLNDSYNQVSSDWASEISDFRSAYLYFKGVKLTEETLKRMNESGIITMPNKDGKSDLGFLTKNIDTAFIKEKIEQLEKKIYDVAGQVNFNDTNLGSNTSSLALRNKLTVLINKLSLKEGFLREAISLRMKNLSEYMYSTKTNIDTELIDHKSVDVSFIYNIPTSDAETAKMVVELFKAGLVSKETAITQLSFVNQAQDEIEKLEAEENYEIDKRVGQLFDSKVGAVYEQRDNQNNTGES